MSVKVPGHLNKFRRALSNAPVKLNMSSNWASGMFEEKYTPNTTIAPQLLSLEKDGKPAAPRHTIAADPSAEIAQREWFRGGQ